MIEENPGHWAGMGMVLGGHVVGASLALLALLGPRDVHELGRLYLLMLGYVQLPWVAPLAMWADLTGRRNTIPGMVMTAAVIFGLNLAFWIEFID